jgi:mono/diheme cytochrome c family protein
LNKEEKTIMSRRRVSASAVAFVALTAATIDAAADPRAQDVKSVQRGRYLVLLAGCNDCHTADYALSGGKVPEARWLTGDQLDWRGPWGTTYPSNLRLVLQKISEDQWVRIAHTAQYRPPMPWYTLHGIKEQDLRAMYRYIRHLGPAGEPAPAFVPADRTPSGPYVQFPAPPQR